MSDPSAPACPAGASAVQVLEMTAATATALERLARSLGLDAVRIDLAGCDDKPMLLERAAAALDFPDWFGGNWDAFYDCLADLGWRPARGYVLLVENTADMRRSAPEALDTALAILGDAADAWAARDVPFRAFVAA
jgi:RNAse (barnase) inhibitor barstar